LPRSVQVAVLLATLLASVTASAQDFDQAGFDLATSTILCDCGCHPQSVHDCACGRAAEMRDEIRALVEGGMTGDQVVAKYVAEHGDQIRIAPRAVGFNLVAWLGPLLVLLAASGAMALVLRRWSARRRESQEPQAPASVDSPPEDDPYRQRLDRALENME
jgi:cytochrome c-type biogenesis protein CcmH/NrfF